MSKMYTKVVQEYTQEKDGKMKNITWEMGKIFFKQQQKDRMFSGL